MQPVELFGYVVGPGFGAVLVLGILMLLAGPAGAMVEERHGPRALLGLGRLGPILAVMALGVLLLVVYAVLGPITTRS